LEYPVHGCGQEAKFGIVEAGQKVKINENSFLTFIPQIIK